MHTWLFTMQNKKRAYDVKIPVSSEDHQYEIKTMDGDQFDIEENAKRLHKKMKTILKPAEWKVYNFLYIEHREEKELAKLMGYKTSEKNRSPGYKQIKNIKKSIISKVKKIMEEGEVDFY